MFCTTCQEIFRGQLNLDSHGWSEAKIHHPDPQSLIRSATQGCYICNTLYDRHLDGKGISKPDLLEQVRYTMYKLLVLGARIRLLRIRVENSEIFSLTEYDSYSVKAHVSVTKSATGVFI